LPDTDFLRDVMPLAGTLGIRTIVATPGEVRARLDWSEKLCTSGGVLHGGALMALADTTGGACAFHNLPEGASGTTTIESKTNFLRAVRERYAEAVSKPLHVGRTIIVIDTEVFDAGGRLVSRTTQSQAVLRPS
jgi:1,4-dihydroxy-2-naphthoyl-CoA hydrolase